MNTGISYFKCFLHAPDAYKESVLSFVASKVTGRVLEIGAGATPWYWAIAYIHKVSEVVFTDVRPDFLSAYEEFIQTVDATDWEKATADTIALLKRKNILAPDHSPRLILEHLFLKSRIQTASFEAVHTIPGLFDTVLSIEAVECVNSYDQLHAAFTAIYQKLQNNGLFVAVVLPYIQVDDRIQSLIDSGLEGQLNPDKKMIEQVATEVGFSDIELHEQDTGKTLYPRALYISMRRRNI
jgi:hypothetical protein